MVAWATLVLLGGCAGADRGLAPAGSPSSGRASSAPSSAAPRVTAFPGGQPFDYQIGGGYPPDSAVRVVSRDRADRPDPDRYSVCYVNGYQVQAQELAWWRARHPDLLLRDAGGHLVVDEDWHEVLLDLRTPATRAGVLDVVGGWVQGCARSGFQAVELDNLDSYLRSDGLLTRTDALALATGLAGVAHRNGLAVGQKNAPELADRLAAAGYDFAVAEECAEYDECAAYTAAYGAAVVDIEYTRSAFTKACRDPARPTTTLRDRDVTPRGERGFVDARC